MLEGPLRTMAREASAIVLLSFTLSALVASAVGAVLLYGFGLSFLARYSRGWA